MYLMPETKADQDTNIAQTKRLAPGLMDTLTVSNIALLVQQGYSRLKMIANEVDGRDMTSPEAQNIIGGRQAKTVRFMNEPAIGLDSC